MKVKEVFDMDRRVRAVRASVDECFIKQLLRDDLSYEEKRSIADKLKEMEVGNAAWEGNNDKWWYEYGKLKGEAKGVFIGGACVIGGYLIGGLIETLLKK